MQPQPVPIRSTYIELDNLLKRMGAAATGGQAKHMIRAGLVVVNDAVETRRGRKCYPGDRVALQGSGVWLVVDGSGQTDH